MTGETPTVDVLLHPEDLLASLVKDAVEGLSGSPKQLPPKWFYDERGSRLFDEITRLPEYYLTRAELEILHRDAPDIARLADADTLVELGSGTSAKTRVLLGAMARAGTLRRYVPFDVDKITLRAAARAILTEFEGVAIHGVVGDFEKHLVRLPRRGRRLIAFLGSTIGNLDPPARKTFLTDVSAGLNRGDSLLLGADLVKDVRRLEAAYNDPAGITAAFNKNVLAVINRLLRADFDLDLFEHVAFFDIDNEWIEMRLRAREEHRVHIEKAGMTVSFERGEEIRTEISAKFRRDLLGEELASAGLSVARWWTDRAGDFALVLATSE